MNLSLQTVEMEPVTEPFKPHLLARKRIGYAALCLIALQQVILVVTPIVSGALRHQPIIWKSIFIGNFTQWDSHWFLQIAKDGYTNIAHTAFFPLYPLVIRVAHMSTGLGYKVSALLVSLVCFLISVYVLGLWLDEQFNRRTAYVGMALLVLFPTAFYFRAAYSESMFLAFAMLAVYASSHRKFIAAGAFAAMAALTRNTGIFLDVVLLLDYIGYRQRGWVFWRPHWWRQMNGQLIGLLLPIAGLLAYFTWLRIHTGHFLSFVLAEHIWHRTYSAPWMTVGHSLLQLFTDQPVSLLVHQLFELGAWVLIVIALVFGVRYARQSSHHLGNVLYLGFVLYACSVAPASTGPALQHWDYLLSMPRFDLMMYPAFAYLALRLRTNFSAGLVLCCSTGGLVLCYGIFCAGHFIA